MCSSVYFDKFKDLCNHHHDRSCPGLKLLLPLLTLAWSSTPSVLTTCSPKCVWGSARAVPSAQNALAYSTTRAPFALPTPSPPQVLDSTSPGKPSLSLLSTGFRKCPHLGTGSGHLGECRFLEPRPSPVWQWWQLLRRELEREQQSRGNESGSVALLPKDSPPSSSLGGSGLLSVRRAAQIYLPAPSNSQAFLSLLLPSHHTQRKLCFYLFQANLRS